MGGAELVSCICGGVGEVALGLGLALSALLTAVVSKVTNIYLERTKR